MYNCEIEFANLNINWRFPYMASQLPSPSTEAFDVLVKGLRPFEITARSINLESPTSNLDDVAITINLLKPQINLRIAYSGIEIEARDVEEEEVEQILQILNLTFQSLEKIDSEFKNGNGNVKVSFHLRFINENNNCRITSGEKWLVFRHFLSKQKSYGKRQTWRTYRIFSKSWRTLSNNSLYTRN